MTNSLWFTANGICKGNVKSTNNHTDKHNTSFPIVKMKQSSQELCKYVIALQKPFNLCHSNKIVSFFLKELFVDFCQSTCIYNLFLPEIVTICATGLKLCTKSDNKRPIFCCNEKTITFQYVLVYN